MLKRFSRVYGVSLIVAASAFAVASMGMDEYASAVDGQPAGTGRKNCFVTCSNGVYIIGTCLNFQTCCGYRNCSTGSEQLTCCSSSQDCHQDFTVSPPVNECVAKP